MNQQKAELFIDTSRHDKTIVGLKMGKTKIEKTHDSPIVTSQVLLPLIDSILKENSLTIEKITSIQVAQGPGSYTGLRVGAAVANTLGWLIGIPVNGSNKSVEPIYS